MTFTTVPAAGAKLRAATLSSLVTELRPVRAQLGADFPLATGTTTLANVTGLLVAVAANTTYVGQLFLAAILASGTTEDIQIAMTWPTGATVHISTGELVVGATTFSSDFEMVYRENYTSGTAICSAGLNATLATWTMLNFTIATGANAGNLQVQAAQNTSGANVVTVQSGSYLRIQQET
jgi:hypothetical protein